MAKDERLYARFDIGMDEHPKVMLLTDSAFRTLFEVTLYARRQLTDGFLADGVIRRRWPAEAIQELKNNDPVKPSLYPFEKDGVQGLMIHDYEKHQTTTADIEAKREAGRKGGLAKAKQTSSKNVDPAREVLQQNGWQNASAPLAITETETETKKETLKNKDLVQPSVELKQDFEKFWAVYPRKQGKADALKAYKAAVKKHPAKTIFAGAQAYALLNAGEDKSFLKLPGGWLRGERWEDEQIVNATRATNSAVDYRLPECVEHSGYPLPCDRCAREGRAF